MINYILNGKVMVIHLMVGFMKKDMNEYQWVNIP